MPETREKITIHIKHSKKAIGYFEAHVNYDDNNDILLSAETEPRPTKEGVLDDAMKEARRLLLETNVLDIAQLTIKHYDSWDVVPDPEYGEKHTVLKRSGVPYYEVTLSSSKGVAASTGKIFNTLSEATEFINKSLAKQ